MKDLYHDFLPELSIYPQALTAPQDGDAIINLQGFEGALIIIAAGVITDGTLYTFELKHGDTADLVADGVAVPAADLVGAEPAFAQATDGNSEEQFAYVGTKQYLRVDLLTATGTPSTGGIFTALIVKGRPRHAPAV